ncbi:GNAT family N-acetyltransferase [Cellulosimicrobium marinum]|uniref:GNAT family N-acetyltransferase n=1 Tax=Cellulosimicrobium marinum TaxID=1638992 RepID=UPI001E40A436|nr:GNAT family N-acetyltransferase [Cellulosimicrobium marinum]MCB7137860.1 GNAT family N-acetyltransferase [Cellulosimicrobium marinum]
MAMFAPIPLELRTARTLLTPLRIEDTAWLTRLFATRDAPPVDETETRRRIGAMDALVAQGIGARVLRPLDGSAPLGYVAVLVGRGTFDEPEIAWELLPEARGQGCATEAATVLRDAALATGRRRLWATMRPVNASSRRVAEKLGMTVDRTTTDGRGTVEWWSTPT